MALAWIIGIFMVAVVVGAIISPSSSISRTSSPQKSSNIDQEAGRQFIGLTRQELIEKLGSPIKSTTGSNPQDGNFEIFTYDNSNENATLFHSSPEIRELKKRTDYNDEEFLVSFFNNSWGSDEIAAERWIASNKA